MNALKKFWRDLQRQWEMFRELWKTVPEDCRGALIGELIFNPRALERRHHNEQAFKSRMDRRWQNIEEEE